MRAANIAMVAVSWTLPFHRGGCFIVSALMSSVGKARMFVLAFFFSLCHQSISNPSDETWASAMFYITWVT